MSAKASTISESSLHCTTIGFVPFYFLIRLTTFSAKPKKSDRIEVIERMESGFPEAAGNPGASDRME